MKHSAASYVLPSQITEIDRESTIILNEKQSAKSTKIINVLLQKHTPKVTFVASRVNAMSKLHLID